MFDDDDYMDDERSPIDELIERYEAIKDGK
jgi:hypothetical protein